MEIIRFIANCINQIFNVLNFTIPGFPLSVAQIILGITILGVIIGINKNKESGK